MGKLYVDSFYTSTPLNETTNIWTNFTYNESKYVGSISKSNFEKMLSSSVNESHITFNMSFYNKMYQKGIRLLLPLLMGFYAFRKKGYKTIL